MLHSQCLTASMAATTSGRPWLALVQHLSPLETTAGHGYETPDVKRDNVTTPPPHNPSFFPWHSQDEIDNALTQGSLPLLQVALLDGHARSRGNSIFEAVRRQHPSALEFLLRCDAFAATLLDEQCGGVRPLHCALNVCIHEGDDGYIMAELLLRYGASPNVCPGDCREELPPLHSVVRRGSNDAARLLLRYGADVSGIDAQGQTALCVACATCTALPSMALDATSLWMVDDLLRHGACPLQVSSFVTTSAVIHPLMRAKIIRAIRWWHRSNLWVALGCRAGGNNSRDRAVGSTCNVAVVPACTILSVHKEVLQHLVSFFDAV